MEEFNINSFPDMQFHLMMLLSVLYDMRAQIVHVQQVLKCHKFKINSCIENTIPFNKSM